MCAISVNSITYNPKKLVNNPPYITNYPFYEYLVENKMDFKHAQLDLYKETKATRTREDNFMTSLLVVTLGVMLLAVIFAKKKVQNAYRFCIDGCKNLYRKTFHR